METAWDTETISGYTVRTYVDPDPLSPREWDNVGRFAGLNRWTFNDDEYGEPYRSARDDAGEPILAIPVTVLDGPYTIVRETTWHGAEGIYYAPLSKVATEQFDGPGGLRACLRGEIATLNQYLSGDVYGYVVEGPEGEHVDSCWGFFGADEALSEGKAAAEHEAFRAACLWAECPAWVQETVLIWTSES